MHRHRIQANAAFSLEPKTMKNGTRIAFAVDPSGYKIGLIERLHPA